MSVKIWISILLVGIMVSSCVTNSLPKEEATGALDISCLNVKINTSTQVLSKVEDIPTADYKVTIFNAATNATVKAFPKYSEMPEVIVLPASRYRIEVRSIGVDDAGFEKPDFMGTKEFVIKANEITSIGQVECALQNVCVSVGYSDQLLPLLGNDVMVTVTVGGNSLVFVHGETRHGYFKYAENNRNLVVKIDGTIEGAKVTETHTLTTDVLPNKHYKVKFTYRSNPTIEVK